MTTKGQRPWRASAKAVEGDSIHPDSTESGPADNSPIEAAGHPPKAAELPEGITTLAQALAELVAILPGLRAALDRQADNRPRIEPMALRPEDLEAAIGVDDRTIQRWRSAGKFPKPDIQRGRILLWRVESIRQWLESGGRP